MEPRPCKGVIVWVCTEYGREQRVVFLTKQVTHRTGAPKGTDDMRDQGGRHLVVIIPWARVGLDITTGQKVVAVLGGAAFMSSKAGEAGFHARFAKDGKSVVGWWFWKKGRWW